MDTARAQALSNIESPANEGAVTVINVDGARQQAGNPNLHTVVLTDGARRRRPCAADARRAGFLPRREKSLLRAKPAT